MVGGHAGGELEVSRRQGKNKGSWSDPIMARGKLERESGVTQQRALLEAMSESSRKGEGELKIPIHKPLTVE